MAYGKVHRFFLRTVASQGVLSIPDAQTILEKFNEQEELLSVTDIVKAINDEIRQYYQEIKITKDEMTDEDCIVFLSVADDAATKAQNIFSATELEYFRVLIEQIMSTESRQITKINAMNLVSSMKSNFTKTDAQKVLNTWCRMHYFEKEQDNYALGLRAIHEFEGYFRQNMEHAVEECFLCKHIVFRGYNCPGCGKAIHTRCLKRYLERVKKWPCCKLDFEQEQLERLNNEGSRLPPTQLLDTTTNSEENNTVPEPTQVQESSELMDETQDVIPEISQRLTRKRKRQISQTQVSATLSSTEGTVAAPMQDAISRRSSRDSTVAAPTQDRTSRRSSRDSTVAAPTQDATSRRSSRDSTVAAPTQGATSRRSSRDSTVEAPAEVTTTRRSTRGGNIAPKQVTTTRSSAKSSVAVPTRVATTRRDKKDSTLESVTEVTTPNRSTRSGAVAAPTTLPSTRRSTRQSSVETPTQDTTTRRTAKSGAVVAPIQVPTTRRSTRTNIPEEPVTEIQESFKSMEVKEEVTQRVTRKRKQQ